MLRLIFSLFLEAAKKEEAEETRDVGSRAAAACGSRSFRCWRNCSLLVSECCIVAVIVETLVRTPRVD